MSKLIPKNHLSDNFYRLHETAKQTMSLHEFQETMLETGGEIFSCGKLWTICGKRLAPGVYQVTLREANRGI